MHLATCSRSSALALALVAAWCPAAAQANKPSEGELEKELMDLLNTPIVSASKHAERTIEAPSVVDLAVRNQVDAYGWQSLNDYLYTLPGFSASQDYDRSTVSSRGLFEGWNNNHLLLQVDGIPFNDNLYGSAYTWEITPIFMAQQVEVLRGPGSALYGSNAMNGVIQVKTVSAPDLPAGGQAQIRTGQDNLRIYDYVVGLPGLSFNTVLGFSLYQSDGNSMMDYDGSARTDAAGNLEKFYVDDARKNQYAWVKLEGAGDLQGLTAQFHWQAWNFKTGHGWLWQIPDQGETMQEARQVASLAYASTLGASWHQEYLLRHQVHDILWNTRYYPGGAFVDPAVPGSGYPAGGTEYLDTHASDDFFRAQWTLDLPHKASLLLGFEGDRFLYTGDRSHYANLNLVTFTANPGGENLPAGPWLAWIQDRPLLTTGFYAQFDSGMALGRFFKTVLGLRADRLAFDFNVLDAHESPTGTQASKSYANTSPRVVFVFMPSDNLSFKLMGGRAFRSPAPAELAGANTLSLGSNIYGLKPETLTTYEGAVDWIINPSLDWRTNVFWTKFNNEIAYSASNYNLSTNVYTLTTEGLESELLFGAGPWQGFLNVSFARRVDETVLDTTITPSQEVTWVPSRLVKFGVIHKAGAFTGSVSGTWTGRVLRRASDVGSQPIPLQGTVLNMDTYRPETVSPWFVLNAKAGYALSRTFEVSVIATNLLDKKYDLPKTLAFPFDYQQAGRNVSLALKVSF